MANLPPLATEFKMRAHPLSRSAVLWDVQPREANGKTCRCSYYQCTARVACDWDSVSSSLFMRCGWITALCQRHKPVLFEANDLQCSNCCRHQERLPDDEMVCRYAEQSKYISVTVAVSLCDLCTRRPHVRKQFDKVRMMGKSGIVE